MRTKLVVLTLVISSTLAAHGQHRFKVLHSFGMAQDGAGLWSSVVFDKSGNLYGTTSGGGAHNGGTTFKLASQPDGQWAEQILHSFLSFSNDGSGPFGGVILDLSGNLYGTTQGGGGPYTNGTVYKLSPSPHGWRETLLHRFGKHDQACCPWGNLVRDPGGNLYGTGGDFAFEVSPGRKRWTETILHDFTGNDGDGLGPQAGPIRDAAGNLYGTTLYGGGGPLCSDGCGTVWELQPPAREGSAPAAWTERILHRFGFSDNDGVFPGLGQLAMDADGNLYGTANGGKYRTGIVFKLTRGPAESTLDDVWRETILYNFRGGADGNHPSGGVILDKAGNLYGTTITGGSGAGVVFKLSPRSKGGWKYTLLHTFNGSDGDQPDANLTLGPDGKLYGTTATGGAHGGGVVFQLTP